MRKAKNSNDHFHVSVLKQEVIRYLAVRKTRWYVDATLGGGGHTQDILNQGGSVFGIDRDPQAIEFCKKKFVAEAKNNQLIMSQSPFGKLNNLVQETQIIPYGVVFDLGVSSFQIEGNQRGFSFLKR